MVGDGGDGGVADQTVDGGDVDYTAVSLLALGNVLLHVAGEELGDLKNGGQVQTQGELPIVLLVVHQGGAGAALAAGVVHDDFAVAELGVDGGQSLGDGLGAGDVALHGQDLDAVLGFPLLGAGFQPLHAAGHEHQVGAARGIAFGHLLAETGRRTGDGNYFSCVIEQVGSS